MVLSHTGQMLVREPPPAARRKETPKHGCWCRSLMPSWNVFKYTLNFQLPEDSRIPLNQGKGQTSQATGGETFTIEQSQRR